MNVFEISVTGAVLIFAVILLRAAGRKRLPMRTFTVLWHVALLRLLLPFGLPSPFSAASIGQKLIRPLAKIFSRPDGAGAADISASPASSGVSHGTFFFETAPSDAPPISEAFHTAGGIAQESASSARFAPDWRLIVWIAGAVLCLSLFAAFYVRALKRFRQSLPLESDFARDWLAAYSPGRKIEVRRSDRIGSPLTYGVLRPVILLPSDLDLSDTKRLEFILAHELTHIRHFDSLTKILLALAVSLHWFNPAAWVLYRFFNRDMELACDEAVVRMFGADTRRDYALMLLELVEKKNPPPMPANGFGQVAIRERIGAIMKVRRITWAASLAAVIAVCGITAVFATTAVTARENPEEPGLPEQTDALAAEEEEQKRLLEAEIEAEQAERQIMEAEQHARDEAERALEVEAERQRQEEARQIAEEQARLQAEQEAQLRRDAEQDPEAEIPVWEKLGITEDEYLHGEKYQKIREKLEQKEAERAAEEERERMRAEVLAFRAAKEAASAKWLDKRQIFDRICEILLTGAESREDRLASLDALILEFRADFRYNEEHGSMSLMIFDTAEGEPEWEPYSAPSYEALRAYYEPFAPYGVTCEPREGTETGDPYWNGQPVTSWEDILFTADGSSVRRWFIAEHNFRDAVSVRVVYDGETVVGVEINPNR